MTTPHRAPSHRAATVAALAAVVLTTFLVGTAGATPAGADGGRAGHTPLPTSTSGRGDRDGDADADRATTVTEDTDANDGGTPEDVVDHGDDRHPSGRDRSVEEGGSLANPNQGRAESDPDDDGRGPDRSNGGPDEPGGHGGADPADQDGNNGCGNDDDFEDDNEGWCGRPPGSGPRQGAQGSRTASEAAAAARRATAIVTASLASAPPCTSGPAAGTPCPPAGFGVLSGALTSLRPPSGGTLARRAALADVGEPGAEEDVRSAEASSSPAEVLSNVLERSGELVGAVGGSLPVTGLGLTGLVTAAGVLLGAGAYLRRRARAT